MSTSTADQTLTVAALQMRSAARVDANLRTADRLLAQAASQGAALAVLPEYFCFMGMSERDKVAIRETDAELDGANKVGPIQQFLSDAAKAHRLTIVGGTVPLASPEAHRVFNSTLVYGPDGRRLARYDKIHLFRFERASESYDEARTITPGSQPTAFDLSSQGGVWRIGLTVCYDLRFPELYRTLGVCDAVVVPSAFTFTTGQAHWQTLLQARAIENQCYVIAAAQGSGASEPHENGRRTFGHSMTIDPWGEVLASLTQGEGVVMATLSRTRIAQVREQLPALTHRVLPPFAAR
jgi:nitrilase